MSRWIAKCLALLILICSPTFAWNATGHAVIAEMAYQHLTPEAKKHVDELLATFAREYPRIRTLTRLSPWADQIRSQKIEYFTHWHYIDVPFSTDGSPLKNITDTDNAVWALEKLEAVLENPYANRFERARALAFIVHITGDLHQPLHTVSRVSHAFPTGDRGGNLFSLTSSLSSANNLHHLWDTGVGRFAVSATDENIQRIANEISERYPVRYFGEKIDTLDAHQWAQEGLKSARTVVYATSENAYPNEDYLEAGQRLSESRAALAAYRLAAILNQTLG